MDRHLMNDDSKVKTAIQNMLDVEKAFCHETGQKDALSECLDRHSRTPATRPESPEFSKLQVGIVLQPFVDSFKDAVHNVFAMEAFCFFLLPMKLSAAIFADIYMLLLYFSSLTS